MCLQKCESLHSTKILKVILISTKSINAINELTETELRLQSPSTKLSPDVDFNKNWNLKNRVENESNVIVL